MHIFFVASEVVLVVFCMIVFAYVSLYMYTYMGVSLNGGEIPNNHGSFLPKMIILGCEMGVPPFKETPIYLSVSVNKICGGVYIYTAYLKVYSSLVMGVCAYILTCIYMCMHM